MGVGGNNEKLSIIGWHFLTDSKTGPQMRVPLHAFLAQVSFLHNQRPLASQTCMVISGDIKGKRQLKMYTCSLRADVIDGFVINSAIFIWIAG